MWCLNNNRGFLALCAAAVLGAGCSSTFVENDSDAALARRGHAPGNISLPTSGPVPAQHEIDDCNKNGVSDWLDVQPSSTPSQWATAVGELSSQFRLSGGWSSNQILGEPNTFLYADVPTAWAPLPRNGTVEYITVLFDEAVHATGVTIRETWGNGMVFRIDLVDIDDRLRTVWNGVDPSQPGSPVDFEVDWPATQYLVIGVRIHLDTDHNMSTWEELDAIQLHGEVATSADCNDNGLPDECEADTNTNGIADACELTDGSGSDCNGNGVPDIEDVAGGSSDDCNSNGLPDECDVDDDADGIPDDCDTCPGSDLSDTIVLRECDTGVANMWAGDDGCTMADMLHSLDSNSRSRSHFVRGLARMAKRWQKSGLISPTDRRHLTRCALVLLHTDDDNPHKSRRHASR